MIACVNCGQAIMEDVDLAGQILACPACGQSFVMPQIAIAPPAVVVSRPLTKGGRRHRRTAGTRITRFALLLAFFFGAIGALIGLVLSQYLPLFGGFLVHIGEPFSPVRLQVALGHALICGFAGAALGDLFGAGIQAAFE